MKSLKRLVADALKEDIGQEDITTTQTVPPESRCCGRLVAKQGGVLSGIDVFRLAFELLHTDIEEWKSLADGTRFSKGDEIASFKGNTRAMLSAERTALNFLARLSGVATLTAKHVAAIKGLDVRICDTRKTTPLLRNLEKKAVVHGGGMNHRYNLFNGILIKENHITANGGIRKAIKSVVDGTHHLMKVEVEVASLEEFDKALRAGADAIMLDNMGLEDLREAVRRAGNKKVIIEASGNVTLKNIRQIAETGVDVISIGALTHSAPAVDFSLLITKEKKRIAKKKDMI